MFFGGLLLYSGIALTRSPSSRLKKMEQLVEYNLRQRVDKKMCYRLINGFIFGDKDHFTYFINHVVINNNGIFIIHTFDVEGEVNGSRNDQYWKIGENEIPNPLMKLNEEASLLMAKFNNLYPIYPVMLFINDNKNNTGIETVVTLKELPLLLDTFHIVGSKVYKREEVINIYEELKKLYYSQPSLETHLRNVERINNSIDKNTCPICGMHLEYEMDNVGHRYLKCTSSRCDFRILK